MAQELARAVGVVAGAAVLSAGLIVLLRPLLVRYLLAHPNARSSHARATPQGAGIAVVLAVLMVAAAAWLLWRPAEVGATLGPVLAGALGLTLLGLADDAHALPVSWRLIGQALAAIAMVFSLPEDLRLFPASSLCWSSAHCW